MTLDGRKKAAVLVLALGPDAAAKALRCLPLDAVADLASAVTELERAPIAPDLVESVLAEFRASLEEDASGVGPSDATLRKLVEGAVGPERGTTLLADVERERRSRNPFAEFAELDTVELGRVLEDELPQVQALVLAHIPTELAAQVLAGRPEADRTDLLLRMARLEDVAADVSLEVGSALGAAAASRARHRRAAGVAKANGKRLRSVASIVNVLEENEQSRGQLERLREKDKGLAASIEEQTFVFDDLALLDDRGLQKVLSTIDGRVLALALKAAEGPISAKLLGNLSKRARESVLEEKEMLGPQPITAVEGAQQEILKAIRGLIQSGELKIRRGKESALVA